MMGWETAICEANGINIHYTRTAERKDKPPLVCLHGLMTNGASWTPVARGLAGDYEVILPDARGHGKSSVPDFGYQYADHANDVVGLLNALRLSRPILVGHSMGGMTATMVASRNPELIGGLILADPSFLSPKIQREVRDSDVVDQHRRILGQTLEQLINEATLRNSHRPRETLELLAQARLQTSLAAFDVLTPPNPDFRELVKAIHLPCLLVIGQTGVVTPQLSEELQSLNPRLQVQVVEKAGHGLHFDQPERFAGIVKDFLSKLAV